MVKRFWSNSDTMVLAFMVWLCTLPLVALLIVPFFGLKVAGSVALVLFLLMLVVCWYLCRWHVPDSQQGVHNE
jgi:uncharacterized membrane protein (DUF4010 family)